MGGSDDGAAVQRKAQLRLRVPYPLYGYQIQPNELMRLASHIIKCPKCAGMFDEMDGRKPISTP
jgi:hypothetical protein